MLLKRVGHGEVHGNILFLVAHLHFRTHQFVELFARLVAEVSVCMPSRALLFTMPFPWLYVLFSARSRACLIRVHCRVVLLRLCSSQTTLLNACTLAYLQLPVFPFCLSVCLSVCLSCCRSICLFVCLSLSLFLSVWFSLYLFLSLSVSLPVYLSVCLYLWLSICQSVCLLACLSVYLSLCLSSRRSASP